MHSRCASLFAVHLFAVLASAQTDPAAPFAPRSVAPPAAASHESLSTSDLAELRAAVDALKHAVRETPEGLSARNPGQRWELRFDGRGVDVRPDAGRWAWGLELLAFGRSGAEREVELPDDVRHDGGRVSYVWDDTLAEWFVNDRRGLEHGYTLSERPAGAEGPLHFTLAVRGDLAPSLRADGRNVAFVDAGGVCVVDYAGLTVFDADGADVPARFVLPTASATGAATLLLVVDDQAARYPLTIDPVAQQAYIKSSNSWLGDSFGDAVAVSGDTAVVGASFEDGGSTGVNGDESSQSSGASGAAYVFVRNSGGWSQQAYLKATNTGTGDAFGTSVAISGDTIVVGAFREDSNATGVDGDGANNSLTDSGAAYVYVRNGTTWSPQAYLKSSAGGFDDWFGISVGVSGDTIVVGANQEDSNATGIGGTATNNSSFNAGAAYVFVRNGGTWSLQAYLKASNTSVNDHFGRAVTISGETIAVGAFQEDSSATGVNGDQASNAASNSGAAYVFVRSGGTWTQQAYLKASNTGPEDQFGRSVSASGDLLVVGAFSEDSSATGVGGDQADNGTPHSGAAYVFRRSGTSWSQEAYLKASNTGTGDAFGWAVSADGDLIVVGADQEGSQATGVDGDQGDDSLHWAGSAYVFRRSGGLWHQLAYLKASNTGANDEFGAAVAVSGDVVLVGATGEDSEAAGIGGTQGDDHLGANSGAVYAFDAGTGATGQFIDLGFGLAGAHAPVLTGSGSLAAGGSFTLAMTDLPPAATSYVVVGFIPLFAPFKGGVLGPSVDLLVPVGSGAGALSLPASSPPGIPSGASLYVQTWTADAGGPAGFDATNVLQCLFP